MPTCNNCFQWSKVIKHLSWITNPDDNTRDCALRSPALSHILYPPPLPQPENQDAAAHSSQRFNCEMVCLGHLYTDKLRDVGRSILNQNGMENTSQGNFEPSGKAYFDRCFPLFGDELEAMETRFGTVNTWPGDLPHSFTSTTQGGLLSCAVGSASQRHLARPRPFTKRGKYVLWSPPAQAQWVSQDMNFRHFICSARFIPEVPAAFLPPPGFHSSAETDGRFGYRPSFFHTGCLCGMVYFEHLPSWITTFPKLKAHCCFLVRHSVCLNSTWQENSREEFNWCVTDTP